MKINHAQLLAHFQNGIGLRLERRNIPIHLNKQHGPGVYRQPGVGVVLHCADKGLLLKLHDGWHNTTGHDGRNSPRGVFNFCKGHTHGPFGLRQGNKLEGYLGYDTQRALGTRK